jgi:hypothetical protein
MTTENPENLDEMLGSGAMDDLSSRLAIGEIQPEITETIWDVVDGGFLQFPPESGRWIRVAVEWEHGEQSAHFKDDKVYMGEGLCNVRSNPTEIIEMLGQMRTLLSSDSDSPFFDWCNNWGVNTIHIPMPAVLTKNFELMGMETSPNEDGTVTMIASTAKDGKLYEFGQWVRAGMVEADRPEWMTLLLEEQAAE